MASGTHSLRPRSWPRSSARGELPWSGFPSRGARACPRPHSLLIFALVRSPPVGDVSPSETIRALFIPPPSPPHTGVCKDCLFCLFVLVSTRAFQKKRSLFNRLLFPYSERNLLSEKFLRRDHWNDRVSSRDIFLHRPGWSRRSFRFPYTLGALSLLLEPDFLLVTDVLRCHPQLS